MIVRICPNLSVRYIPSVRTGCPYVVRTDKFGQIRTNSGIAMHRQFQTSLSAGWYKSLRSVQYINLSDHQLVCTSTCLSIFYLLKKCAN